MEHNLNSSSSTSSTFATEKQKQQPYHLVLRKPKSIGRFMVKEEGNWVVNKIEVDIGDGLMWYGGRSSGKSLQDTIDYYIRKGYSQIEWSDKPPK